MRFQKSDGQGDNQSETYTAQKCEYAFENMKKHASERKFNFTYLHDEDQAVAKLYGGECTPHFFVFDKERKLQYQGRLDDNWRNPEEVKQHDLKNAITALLEGKQVPVQVTSAMGCSIKWLV